MSPASVVRMAQLRRPSFHFSHRPAKVQWQAVRARDVERLLQGLALARIGEGFVEWGETVTSVSPSKNRA
jgi:hypothetical protein